jgi:hypothetical protein
VEAEPPSGIEKLGVCRDQDSAFGLVSSPGEGSGELKSIGALVRKAAEQSFRR